MLNPDKLVICLTVGCGLSVVGVKLGKNTGIYYLQGVKRFEYRLVFLNIPKKDSKKMERNS
jgi:hypothetical protein